MCVAPCAAARAAACRGVASVAGARGADGAARATCVSGLGRSRTHISPWESTLGLAAGAARVLKRGGVLGVYGPFTRDGAFNGESDRAFDASLRARDAAFGYRDIDEVARACAAEGLDLREVRDMPANNFWLVFERE
eukprot:PRCOL_00005771-RA